MRGHVWQDDAACQGTYPDAWFPTEATPRVNGRTGRVYASGVYTNLHMVKDICSRCPVSAECLEFAVSNGIDHGIWGGLSGKQIRKIIETRKTEAAQTADSVSRRSA